MSDRTADKSTWNDDAPPIHCAQPLTRLGGNRTPLQIAHAMQVMKGTMTNTLGHLERAGWIGDPTRRKGWSIQRINITASGRIAHGEAVKLLAPELVWFAAF